MTGTPRRPHTGRRRNDAAKAAILDATFRLLSDPGTEALTIDALAAEAGVGRQTIYRWWPSKAAILLEAITERADQSLDFPDTGDLLADLRGQMYELVRLFTDPMFGAYGRGLIVAAQTDPAISAALLDTLIRPRVQLCIERLAKAQQAGEIRADVDLAVVVELLYAPLYYRMLLHTAPVSSEQVDSVISLVMSGIRP